MISLSKTEPNQLQQRLTQALTLGQILKISSLADWSELVSRYSSETGEQILARFHTDKNQSVTGIYYVLPERDIKADLDSPSPLETAITHLAEASLKNRAMGKGFNLEDWQWGQDLAVKVERGHKMTLSEAQDAFKRVSCYRRQLELVNLSLPAWETMAYRYDPTQKPMFVVEGATLQPPLGHLKQLQAAMAQKAEPIAISHCLLDSGQLLAKIAQHFRSANSGLDGFDLLQSGTALLGIGLTSLGRLREGFRLFEANKLLKQPELSHFTQSVEEVINDLDQMFENAGTILAARDQQCRQLPEPRFSEHPRDRLVQWIEHLDAQQRSLIESLDCANERQIQPIKVTSATNSLKEGIQRLKRQNKELKQLITQFLQEEQPIKIYGGALSPVALHQHCMAFFQAREQANERLFEPHLTYQAANAQGLKMEWHSEGLRVERLGKLVLSLQKQLGGFRWEGKPDLLTATYLSQLPTDATRFKTLSLQEKLLTCLQQHYDKTQRNIEVTGLGKFDFHPCDQGYQIRGVKPNNDLFWQSHHRVEVNHLNPSVMRQLINQLSRPTRTQQQQPFRRPSPPVLSL